MTSTQPFCSQWERLSCRRALTPAPGTERGLPEAPAGGPAGSSFWEAPGGEVGRRPAQDLVLHLQPALLTTLLHQLVLLGAGLAVHNTVVDIGLSTPRA